MSGERDERTLGRVAYDAYRRSWGGGMAWELLDPDQREAWDAAAVAVAYRADELQRELRDTRGQAHSWHHAMTTTQAVRLETAGYAGHARRIEPPFQTQPGDRIGLGECVFRVWRGHKLIADYAAGDDGVLRPVTS